MKKLLSLAALTLLLTSCSSYTVATSDDLKNNPEQVPVIDTWQQMVDAANSGDCQTILDHMRKSLSLKDDSCDAAIAYLKDAPVIDWSRTNWSTEGGKAKIYQENGASISGFILDTKEGTWRADTIFWLK